MHLHGYPSHEALDDQGEHRAGGEWVGGRGGRVEGGEGAWAGDSGERVESKAVEVSLSVGGFIVTDDHLHPDGHGHCNERGEHQAPMQVGG